MRSPFTTYCLLNGAVSYSSVHSLARQAPLVLHMAHRIVHKILHPGVGVDILIYIELVLLVPRLVRLDAPLDVDHLLCSLLHIWVDSRSDRGEDRRTEGRSVAHAREGDGDVRDVGVHLHPQLALGGSAGCDDLFRLEVVFAHSAEDMLGAVAHPLQDRSEDMPFAVAERKPPHHAACFGICMR